jgi:DNA-binding XRE family transcriptional regulator
MTKQKTNRSDPLKALILEKKKQNKVRDCQLAKEIGITRQTVNLLFNSKHTDDWKVSYLKIICQCVGISQADFITALQYK